MITQARLKELFHYDPETGKFVSKRSPGRKVGTMHNAGYRHIGVDDNKYLAHRLAWLYVYGYWPKEIDHIDRNPLNNRIANLREVTRQQNKMNQGPQANSASGERGIDFLERLGKYRVRVCREHLGVFSTLEEAVSVRNKATERFWTNSLKGA